MTCVNRTGNEPHINICRSHPFWITCRVSLSFPALRKRRSQLRKPKQTTDGAKQMTRSRVQNKHIRLEGSTVTAVLHERVSKYAIVWVLLEKALRNLTENNISSLHPSSLFYFLYRFRMCLFPWTRWIKLYLYPSDDIAPPVEVCNRFHENGMRTHTHINCM